MKNIQPDMDLNTQIRKGCNAINAALDQGNLDKACHTTFYVVCMIRGALGGLPQPWSQFQPMIDEEFE